MIRGNHARLSGLRTICGQALKKRVLACLNPFSASPRLRVSLILSGLLVCLFGGEVEGATRVVTNLNDSGTGSLRQTLSDAASGDTITFGVQGTILLINGKLNVDKNLSIAGPGASRLLIDAQGASAVCLVASNVTVNISDLTFTNGASRDYWDTFYHYVGGGVQNLGNLTMTRCVVTGCVAEDGAGGGIFTVNSLTLRQCSISGNNAGGGGGIYDIGSGALVVDSCTINSNIVYISGDGGFAGGLFKNAGSAFLTNSTFSANWAANGNGGGMALRASGRIDSCTIVSNIADFPWGADGGGLTVTAAMECRNTIIAGNKCSPLPDGSAPDIAGALTSVGYNLIQNTNGCDIGGNLAGNIYGKDPLLGPLQNNGGSTLTHALLLGSPAIDQGSSGGLVFDQCGFPRVCDLPDVPNAQDGCDIGSFEYEPSQAFVDFEAETGAITAPMVIGSDPLASQGKYIYSPNTNGSALFNFTVWAAGDYLIWCRVLAATINSDSFFVSVDGGQEMIYDCAERIQSSRWQWTRVIGRTNGDPVINLNPRIFSLARGTHTLLFRARDANTKLDRLLITQDPNFVPVIALEAESATLTAPMSLYFDASAHGGQYVASPEAEQGLATFNFGIPATNQYFVWCQVFATNGGADSFYVSIDKGPELIFDAAENTRSNAWQWTLLNGRTNGAPPNPNPRIFSLAQTNHTLVFRGREPNTGLDRILITDDPTFTPDPSVAVAGGKVTLKGFTDPGRTNLIQATDTLNPPRWTALASPVGDWNGIFTFQEPLAGSSRFYQAIQTGLPVPWFDTDIGILSPSGCATFTNNCFVLTSSGYDIWSSTDTCHCVYQTITSDCTLTARVLSLLNTAPDAKAGVMIRGTLAANSACALTAVTPGNGALFQRRPSNGQPTEQDASVGGTAPCWVRIARSSGKFNSYVSTDGANWTQLAASTATMGSSAYACLVVTAHSATPGVSNTAVFDHVTLTTP